MLHLQDLYKRYGTKTILNDIDLEVAEGEFVSVVGPSGCGKSTLLKAILGQEEVTSGKIFFDNNVIEGACVERGIVYQKYGLFPNLTVLENVVLGKKLAQGWFKYFSSFFKSISKIDEEGIEMLRRVGLDQHANKYPHELSGGMQQRVAIAQSLIMRPKILMMDEPFGALDPGTRESLQLFLMELWQKQNQQADELVKKYQELALSEGKSYEDIIGELSPDEKTKLNKMTIFFVTHDLEEALFVGTRLIVVSQYYTDLNQQGYIENQGAKIVADYTLRDRKAMVATTIKEKAEFGQLVAKIRREGFDPKFAQKVEAFNLEHPDSFATYFSKD